MIEEGDGLVYCELGQKRVGERKSTSFILFKTRTRTISTIDAAPGASSGSTVPSGILLRHAHLPTALSLDT